MLFPRQAGLSVCEGGLIVIIGLFPCNLLFYYLNRLVGKTHYTPGFQRLYLEFSIWEFKITAQGYSSIDPADLILLKSLTHLVLIYDKRGIVRPVIFIIV